MRKPHEERKVQNADYWVFIYHSSLVNPMATIELVPDGPLTVKGVTQCRNSRGEAIAVEDPFYLCRCGASGKKPFCDGTHKKIGFKSAREAPPPCRACRSRRTGRTWSPACRI